MHLFKVSCVAICFVITSFVCHAIAATEGDKSFKPSILDDGMISLATGRTAGIYYPLGKNICRLINHDREELGLRCKAFKTAASAENIDLLQNGQADFAFMQSPWQKYGFYGTQTAQKIRPNEKLRFVMSLYDEYVMFVVRRDSGIKTIDDMKGKIMSSGGASVDTTYNIALEALITAKGWKYSDFKSINDIAYDDQAAALCNKSIDIINSVGGVPNGMIMAAASMCEVNIIAIDDYTASAMITAQPGFYQSFIKGGVYPGINQNIKTLAVKSVLVASTNMSDEIVYNVTKAIMENIASFKKFIPAMAEVDSKNMSHEAAIIPMHPGAARYFKETGYTVIEPVAQGK